MFVGQSAAEDATQGSPSGEPIAPLEALPSDAASSIASGSPELEITAGPAGTVSSPEATFAFSSTAGDSFECSLNGSAFSTCSSPQSYLGLEEGTHLFSVRVISADGASEPAERVWAVQGVMPCTGADETTNFPVYSAGPSVGGWAVDSVIRRCTDPEPTAAGRANFVSYLYGTCPELADGALDACAPPIEIQTWPACERSLADYELAPGEPYPHKSLGELEGVPAYSFDDGTRVELYAGEATIVIFASDPQLIDQAVIQLQHEPPAEPPGEPATDTGAESQDLPDPAPGAIAGKLPCA
jgi:hypothetical protein